MRRRVGVIRGGHARQSRRATCAARRRAVWAERRSLLRSLARAGPINARSPVAVARASMWPGSDLTGHGSLLACIESSPRPPARSRSLRIEQRPARAPARSARSPPGLPGVTDLRDADSAAIETASSATDGTRDSGAGRDINRNRASQRCTAIRQTRRGFPRPERIAATRLRVGVIRGGHARQSRRATCAARRRAVWAERRSLLRSLARAGPINARSPVAVGRASMWPGRDLTGHRIPLACIDRLAQASRPLSLTADRTPSSPRAQAECTPGSPDGCRSL